MTSLLESISCATLCPDCAKLLCVIPHNLALTVRRTSPTAPCRQQGIPASAWRRARSTSRSRWSRRRERSWSAMQAPTFVLTLLETTMYLGAYGATVAAPFTGKLTKAVPCSSHPLYGSCLLKAQLQSAAADAVLSRSAPASYRPALAVSTSRLCLLLILDSALPPGIWQPTPAQRCGYCCL